MLQGTLTLHDIRDVEAHCTWIIQRSRITPQTADHEDLLAYLIATCWELSLPPQRWHTSFNGWATPLLQLRTIDWYRQRHGRTRYQFSTHTYERPQPILLSLNDQLDQPHTTSPSDPEDLCDPDLQRILDPRNSTRTRDLQTLGIRTPQRAA